MIDDASYEFKYTMEGDLIAVPSLVRVYLEDFNVSHLYSEDDDGRDYQDWDLLDDFTDTLAFVTDKGKFTFGECKIYRHSIDGDVDVRFIMHHLMFPMCAYALSVQI